MKEMNLPKMSTSKPIVRNNMQKNDENLSNHLKQNFNPGMPNTAWASDVTYIKTGKGFVYLCIVMDLFSRRVIAYKTALKNDTSLTASAVQAAYISRKPKPNTLIFHSDRGSNYTAKAFREILDRYDIMTSFSAKGYPFDNAVVECFFKFLKHEEVHRRSYSNIDEVNISINEYMTFYNYKRPHSANNGKTPVEREQQYFSCQTK